MYKVTCSICGKERQVKQLREDIDLCRSCAKKKQFKEKKLNFSKRKCKFCGEEFIPNSSNQWYCKKTHIRNCPVCGKEYVEDNVENLKRPPVACSYECRVKRTQKTSLEKYGCKVPGNNKEAREKAKKTCLNHFGTEYAMECQEIRDKSRNSLLKKYGVDNASKVPEFIEKRIKTNIEKYGVAGAFMLPQYHGNTISKINKKFMKLLDAHDIKYEPEKPIGRRKYDIELLESNILIEIDPSYTHSRIPTHWGTSIDKYYHRDKTKLAEDNGYRCIHVFDWDDWDKIINLVKPTKPIYARNCKIYKLNLDVANEFIEENHLQGNCRGTKVAFGLVCDDVLYQVMSFGIPRYNKKYDAELLRLCTRVGYHVVGGASRLFKFATENFGISNIISYCDRSKFNGKVYEMMGMKLSHITPPQEVWSKDNLKITANLLRQRGYDQLFGSEYGKGASNEYLMLLDGWVPVYDCGQKVFTY